MSTVEDILSSVCSRVDPQPSNDFQKVFLLGDEKEARLAQDVLNAHGFTAKLYRENGESRMYIPQLTPEAEKQIPAALAYAQAMKAIKHGLDLLQSAPSAGTPEYTINFNTTSPFDKQISIHLALPASAAAPIPSQASAPASQPVKAPAKPLQQPKKKKPQADLLSAGPEIARQPWFRKKQRAGKPDSMGRQMSLYVKGNMASASAIVMGVVVLLILTYSLFVVSKGWLCPDFAGNDKRENTSWYCK